MFALTLLPPPTVGGSKELFWQNREKTSKIASFYEPKRDIGIFNFAKKD